MNTYSPIDIPRETVPMQRRTQSKAAQRLTLSIFLVAVDLLAVIAGFAAASAIRFGSDFAGSNQIILGAFIPIYLVSAGMMRAYSGKVLLENQTTLIKATSTISVAAAVIIAVLFFLKSTDDVSRLQFALGIFFSFILIMPLRLAFVKYSRSQLGGELYSVVELHDGKFRAPSPFSYNIAGLLDPLDPDADSFNRLGNVIGKADRVIVRCPSDRRAIWSNILQGMNVDAEIVFPEFSEIRPLSVGQHLGETTIVVARGPLGIRDRLIKRLFDIAFSIAALIIMSPLLLVTAIAIKCDSRGPVFFLQPRIGRQNRLFYVYKFRSMHIDRSDHGGHKSTDRSDSRITRVGRLIRQSSIDELPQILNVLKGDMSIVGPRPHAVFSTAENQLFWHIDKRYWHRHACRPGITGLAQVMGLRGNTVWKRDLTERVEADLRYLREWSFWGDIGIILRTLSVIIHKNAY